MHTARRHSICASFIVWLTLSCTVMFCSQNALAWALFDEEISYYTLQIDDQPALPKTTKSFCLVGLAEPSLNPVAPCDPFASVKHAPVARGPPRILSIVIT